MDSQLNVGRYWATLVVLICLLLMDLTLNSISSYAKWSPINLLILFVAQDAGILLALIVLLLSFFQTYMFKVGLVKLLFARFLSTIIICIVYFLLSVSLHIWLLTIHWGEGDKNRTWRGPVMAFYAIQRFMSSFYYYFCKRAGLRLSDPRFYEDEEWIAEQLKKLPNK